MISDVRDGIDQSNRCPSCGYKLDAASSLDATAPRPVVGDLSLCGRCRTAFVFEQGKRGLRVRPMTRAEFHTLPGDTRESLLRHGLALAALDHRRSTS